MFIVPYLTIGFILLSAELLYFRIASRYAIIDKPNNRSSHTGSIIRGGGIIFFIGLLCWFIISDFLWPFFMAGATLVAIISFLDDLKPQRSVVRFLTQLLAVSLLFHQASVYDWPVWLIALAAVVCIGTINAFNFMDGINGMTGVYGLINLASFLYIHLYVIPFSDSQLMMISCMAVLIFLIFNFRNRAKCFAGDVGSITLAFLQIFLLIQLIQATENYFWVIVFLVYGIDSSITIINRLVRKENIFKAHRTHLYQYLCNEFKWPHRLVSLLYGITQLLLNVILISYLPHNSFTLPLISAVLFVVIYLVIRILVVKSVEQRQVV